MKGKVITALLFGLTLFGCGTWNVVRQSTVDFKVTTAGFTDEYSGITVGYAGECHYTTDGGADWKMASNASWCRFGLEIVDRNVAIHCGNAGHVGFSGDGGKSWKLAKNFGDMEPNQCRYLSFPEEKTGWIASARKLAFTSDAGSGWNEIALPQGIGGIESIDLWAAGNGCILDNKLDVYFTGDGGKTWEKETVLTNIQGISREIKRAPAMAMRFLTRNKGMVVLQSTIDDKTRLYAINTSDGCKTWKEEEIPVTIYKGSVLFLSRDATFLTVCNLANGITVIKRSNT
jgi:hypothetical protein